MERRGGRGRRAYAVAGGGAKEVRAGERGGGGSRRGGSAGERRKCGSSGRRGSGGLGAGRGKDAYATTHNLHPSISRQACLSAPSSRPKAESAIEHQISLRNPPGLTPSPLASCLPLVDMADAHLHSPRHRAFAAQAPPSRPSSPLSPPSSRRGCRQPSGSQRPQQQQPPRQALLRALGRYRGPLSLPGHPPSS